MQENNTVVSCGEYCMKCLNASRCKECNSRYKLENNGKCVRESNGLELQYIARKNST